VTESLLPAGTPGDESTVVDTTLGSTGELIEQTLPAGEPDGVVDASTVEDAATPAAETAEPLTAEIGGTVATLVEPVVEASAPAVQEAAGAANATAGPLLDAAGPALAPATEVLSDATESLEPVTEPLVAPLTETVAPITQLTSPATRPVTEALEPLVAPVTDVVDTLVTPVAPVIEPVTPLLPPILPDSGPAMPPAGEVPGPVIETPGASSQPIVVIETPSAPAEPPVQPAHPSTPPLAGQRPAGLEAGTASLAGEAIDLAEAWLSLQEATPVEASSARSLTTGNAILPDARAFSTTVDAATPAATRPAIPGPALETLDSPETAPAAWKALASLSHAVADAGDNLTRVPALPAADLAALLALVLAGFAIRLFRREAMPHSWHFQLITPPA
jgi:hypothetical protein